MKYGYVLQAGDARTICDQAVEAEQSGWDGVFVADAISIEVKPGKPYPLDDPWIVLGAMAVETERVRIGTLITPVSRRRPWKLARETVTLDRLSKGRLTLGVGLGAATDDGGFFKVGEAMDLKTRAELLDEGLEIVSGLWSGKPVNFEGKHYRVDKMSMSPAATQKPRIPVWVVGVWPKRKSMMRAVRWDGVIPQKYKATGAEFQPKPEMIKEIAAFVAENRNSDEPFDIVVGGWSSGKKGISEVRALEEAGATWWLEHTFDEKKVAKRIRQGPPK
jgi:hypothetical protein